MIRFQSLLLFSTISIVLGIYNIDYYNIYNAGALQTPCYRRSLLGKRCPPNAHLINLAEFKDLILSTFYSQLYEFSRGIPPIHWDEERTFSSLKIVQDCDLKILRCPGSKTYMHAGVNVALFNYKWFKGGDMRSIIEEFVTSWIHSPKEIEGRKPSSNSTELCVKKYSDDKNLYIGCAAVLYKYEDTELLIACTYKTNSLVPHFYYSGQEVSHTNNQITDPVEADCRKPTFKDVFSYSYFNKTYF